MWSAMKQKEPINHVRNKTFWKIMSKRKIGSAFVSIPPNHLHDNTKCVHQVNILSAWMPPYPIREGNKLLFESVMPLPKQIQVEITLIHREIFYFSSKYYAYVHIRHLWKCLQPISAIIFRKATAVTHLIPLNSGTNDPVYFQPCCSISWKQTSLWI